MDMDDTLRKDPGEQVNITCRATGNPAPAVKWVVKTGEGGHVPITQWSHESHTLRIDSVQEHHYGEYVCFAENEFGYDTVVLAVGKSNVLVGYKPNIPIGKSNIPAGTSTVPVLSLISTRVRLMSPCVSLTFYSNFDMTPSVWFYTVCFVRRNSIDIISEFV